MEISLEEFVLKHHTYAKSLARHYCNILSELNLEYDDLYQAGCLNLIEWYTKYDNSKSSPSTYAYLMVKYGILNYIRSNYYVTKVPLDLLELERKVSKKMSEVYMLSGKNMTLDEILEYIKNECYLAGRTSIDKNFVMQVLKISSYHKQNFKISLEDKPDYFDASEDVILTKDDKYLKDCIASEYDLEKEALDRYEAEELISYLENNFNEFDCEIFKEIIGLVDGIPKTNRTLAQKYNISHQAINQRYQKVLKKIQKKQRI